MTNSLIEAFLDYLHSERRLSFHTRRAYRYDLEQFFSFVGHDVDAANITSEDVERYVAYLHRERQNAPRTIARRVSTLRSFFRFLSQPPWGLTLDPTGFSGPVSKGSLPPHYLTEGEENRFLRACLRYGSWPSRDFCLFRLFLSCGCRLAEVVELTVADVDLGRSLLVVRGSSGARTLQLHRWTRLALQQYLLERGELSIPNLFVNYYKTRGLSPRGIQYLFKRLAEKAEIDHPRVTVHTLRITYLVRLTAQGLNERTIQELAGHRSLATTRRYTRTQTA